MPLSLNDSTIVSRGGMPFRGISKILMPDRTGCEELPMTPEFLAAILGVRRSTVTVVTRSLQNAGIISCRRGSVRIRSREALQSAACECYEVSAETFHRLLPEVAIGSRYSSDHASKLCAGDVCDCDGFGDRVGAGRANAYRERHVPDRKPGGRT